MLAQPVGIAVGDGPGDPLATRFGVNAADAAHAGEYGMMVSARGQEIGRVSLADATRQLKLVPQSLYEVAEVFFG